MTAESLQPPLPQEPSTPTRTAAVVDEERGEIRIGSTASGDPLWVYRYGARRRPFVHPLCSPAGRLLTCDAPDDHPWHHGLWFAIKFVNGDNFWEEYGDYGVLRHAEVPTVRSGASLPGEITIDGALAWIRPDRRTVALEEHRRLTHRPLDATSYLIDFESMLVPAVDTIFDRTPFTTWGGYSGLAFRGHRHLVDTQLLVDGNEPAERVHGVRGRWLALNGTVAGSPVGVAFLDDAENPGNPRNPVAWYGSSRADTYGPGWANFFNAAFLWDGPIRVAAGEVLRFRYRVLVRDGQWNPATLLAACERGATNGAARPEEGHNDR